MRSIATIPPAVVLPLLKPGLFTALSSVFVPSSPSETFRPWIHREQISSDTFKLLSAFAGRPITSLDAITRRNNISIQSVTAGLTLRLEDLDRIQINPARNAFSELTDSLALKFQNKVSDILSTEMFSAIKPALAFSGSNVTTFPSTNKWKPDSRKDSAEPRSQIYEQAHRDGKPNSNQKNISSKSAKFLSNLIALAGSWLLPKPAKFR